MKEYTKIAIFKLQLQQPLMLSTSSNGDIDGTPGTAAQTGDGHQLSRETNTLGFDDELI